MKNHRIQNGGAVVASGDPKTVGVIFGNLTGKNFSDPRHSVFRAFETHGDYLAFARTFLRVKLDVGDTLELLDGDGVCVEKAEIHESFLVRSPSDQAGILTAS